MSLIEELMQVALGAPDERKRVALEMLKGRMVPSSRPPERPAPEAYLTLKECGARLGFTPSCLWRWRVPGHSLGGRPRFRLAEVEAYLASDAFKRRIVELKAERRRKEGRGGRVGKTARAGRPARRNGVAA